MKLQDPMLNVALTETECKFLMNVLLDWDQSQKNQTETEKKMWEHLITQLDPYLQK
jgi:hypothetical protein